MSDQTQQLREEIIKALRTIQDPEIPVNLYDLGLIYELDVTDEGDAHVVMTLTTPNCPVAESMPGQVRNAVQNVPGVRIASVELTWEPPWSAEHMSDDARAILDMMGISWSDPRALRRAGVTSLTVGRKSPDPKGSAKE